MKVLLIGQKDFGTDVLKAHLKNLLKLSVLSSTSDLEKEDVIEAIALR